MAVGFEEFANGVGRTLTVQKRKSCTSQKINGGFHRKHWPFCKGCLFYMNQTFKNCVPRYFFGVQPQLVTFLFLAIQNLKAIPQCMMNIDLDLGSIVV